MAKKTTPANEPTNDTEALPEVVTVPLTKAAQDRLVKELIALERRLDLLAERKKKWISQWNSEVSGVVIRRKEVMAELGGERGEQIDIYACIEGDDGGDS